ncbi:MAG: adhesin [Chloroflexi bacterium]|nr:adhesin [Chloroflexota bacterium]
MISVTEGAATELQALLEANDAPPGHGVKLVPDGTGSLGMTIAAPLEGDEVVRRGEAPLLIVDSSITSFLDGTVLDVQPVEGAGRQGVHFTLQRPEAES